MKTKGLLIEFVLHSLPLPVIEATILNPYVINASYLMICCILRIFCLPNYELIFFSKIVSSDVYFTKPPRLKDNLEFDQRRSTTTSDIKDHINDIRISGSKENHIQGQTTIESEFASPKEKLPFMERGSETCLAMKNQLSDYAIMRLCDYAIMLNHGQNELE
uniref:Uncharacterized protein n=1 Tax=Glossina austeni TaxID=7395 RepID=A0A1A9VYU7_GLOAU